MGNGNVISKRVFNAPVFKVWSAITDINEMKIWYFDIEEIKLEKGFKFSFTAGEDENHLFKHNCEITEVDNLKKISYSWTYEVATGISFVTFELSEIDNRTLLTLTHSGIDNFPKDRPEFAIENFKVGWESIIHESLKNYLERSAFTQLKVTTSINATLDKVWDYFTLPEHIIHWYFASPEWHSPRAINNLTAGGKFNTRMEAKNGSFGFDFEGLYTNVADKTIIEYILEDNRTVKINFHQKDEIIEIEEIFDAETENTIDMQISGWQAILNNFKFYTENN